MTAHNVYNARMARHGLSKRLLPILLFVEGFCTWGQDLPSQNLPVPDRSISVSTNDTSLSQLRLDLAPKTIWENGVGEGFRSDAQSITVSAGATYGIAAFGTREQHHLAMGSLTYGHMLGHVVGEGHWYRGSPEFRLELFTGAQFSPSREWLVGLTPHLRYNFATGTRWIPFFGAGLGVTATSIGHPDLSGTFEFNLQAGPGIQWFLKHKLAITLEARCLHLSCAGISKPNLGVNGVTGMLGLAFYY